MKKLFENSLVRHSILFIGAEILSKALPFLLLPVLTRFFSLADYGLVATFLAFQNIMAVLTGLSSHGAVNVAYFRMGKEYLPPYIASVMGVLSLSLGISILLATAIFPWLAPRLGLGWGWLATGVVMSAAQFVTQINLVLWQCERRPLPFVIYQLAQTFVGVGLTILLVVIFRWGWRGQLASLAFSSFLFAALSLVILWRRGYLQARPNARDMKDAVRFGAPLIPHSLSGWVLTGIDRFFLTSMVGASATGLYAAGFQIGMILGVAATAFNRAWMPYLFEKLAGDDAAAKIRIVRITYIYFGAILVGVGLLAVFAPVVAGIILGPRFTGATVYIFWFGLAFAFNGMYFMVVNQLLYVKKTHVLATITFCIGFLHIGLTYGLIKIRGPLGASQAVAISFALQFLLVWIASARACPLPWNLLKQYATELE
ncbi:lipopolysaccharide biosynthesis protein [Geothrix sp. 21YS21S-4]|uniref:lipopolysaccharide biosynthesis protein n=1 Tax=Geothrix sp. 21YS21S-4 TaxID=3068889 RepID=UPI0027B88E19|nr:oligosaccharide flippase family protein [Geothrix sp. 21YS21S-4]